MTHRIVCDSCDERIKVGTTCLELRSFDGEGAPVSVTRHYHDLCWDRNVDHLLPKPTLGREVTLSRRHA